MKLNGKTALITGGAIRIGKAISTELANHGVNIAMHYHRSKSEAMHLQNELRSKGVKVELFKADISDLESIPGFFEEVNLVNNAGVFPKGGLLDINKEQLDQVFGINLFAPLFLMRAFAKQIPSDGQGKIVNIVDAKVFKSEPARFAYRLTKIALWEATKMAAMELAPRITVNAISPGLMMSLAGYEHLDMQAVAERRVPLKILGSGEIVAQNLIHILKQDFMTGNNIIIDGGEYIS